jgi:VanZ family protein
MDKERYIDRRSLMIAAGMLVIIAYASLYQFRIRAYTNPAGPFRILFANWNTLTRPSDVLANILFYAPFGFFLARSFTRTRAAATLTLAACSGFLLSFAMESLQFYIVRRNAAMSDVYADTAGALLGATAAFLSRGLTGPLASGPSENRFVLLLLASWLGGRLFPYVPVTDLHKYWDAIKPLIDVPVLRPLDIFYEAVTWLVIGVLFEALFGRARSRKAVGLFLVLVLFARVSIMRIVLSPAEVIGGVAAVLAWALLSRLHSRTIIVTALLVVVVVLQSLEPFQFISTARAFGWIPFRSFLIGSITGAVISFFEKVFVYGCLVWLLTRSGCSWLSATASGVILVMILRLIQVYIPGRSAEITDAVMVLIMAGIMRLISDTGLEQAEAQTA